MFFIHKDLLLSQLRGSHAEMFLHILGKKRCIWEAKYVAHFLDAQVGLAQIVANVFHLMLCYPRVGRLPRIAFAHSREVFWRDTEFVGKRLYGTMSARFSVEHGEKPLEDALR